jgi:pimeloyl-ACP methyl ester carboxylesterase
MEIPQELAVRYAGEGTPVLVIHGWEMFGLVEASDFEPIFTKNTGFLRAYIDLPGMGETPAGNIRNLDSILDSVFGFVERHILPSNFLVIGSSCGAYLARAVAFKYADNVDGLLLRVPLIEPENSMRDVDQFVPAISNEAILASLSAADRALLGDIPVQTPEYVRCMKKRYDELVVPAIAASDSSTLSVIRNDPDLYKVTAPMHSSENPFIKPTLIMTGRQDTVVGYREAWSLLPCYPRASFVLLDRADHGLPVDKIDLDLFESMVKDWLHRIEESRKAKVAPSK